MAISFTLIHFEVGDKVVADIDLHNMYDDLNDDFAIKEGDILTIKSAEEVIDEDGNSLELTFEEVGGYYYNQWFHLHPSTIVRNIDQEE